MHLGAVDLYEGIFFELKILMQQQLFNENIQGKNILPFDGEAYIYQSFFNANESANYFDKLMNTIAWKQDQMILYGREVALPRLTAWYGEHSKDYSYSGINSKAMLWTPELSEIKNRIESISQVIFTSVLLNLYRTGNDHVSWHRDNEKVLRVNPVIGSVSFGATRIFKFRYVKDKSIVKSIELTSGTYLLMKGATQHNWEHTIVKSKKISDPRINLTFRILF